MTCSDLFYLQDSRQYVGNDMLWWCEEGRGYTTDLSKAAKFTKDDAAKANRMRDSDIPWPVDYIDQRQRPTVDMQACKRTEALSGTGIVLAKPPVQKRDITHCQHCGGFLSERQQYIGCPKCGGDNAP